MLSDRVTDVAFSRSMADMGRHEHLGEAPGAGQPAAFAQGQDERGPEGQWQQGGAKSAAGPGDPVPPVDERGGRRGDDEIAGESSKGKLRTLWGGMSVTLTGGGIAGFTGAGVLGGTVGQGEP